MPLLEQMVNESFQDVEPVELELWKQLFAIDAIAHHRAGEDIIDDIGHHPNEVIVIRSQSNMHQLYYPEHDKSGMRLVKLKTYNVTDNESRRDCSDIFTYYPNDISKCLALYPARRNEKVFSHTAIRAMTQRLGEVLVLLSVPDDNVKVDCLRSL